MDTEWLKFWSQGIQTSRKVSWSREGLDGKSTGTGWEECSLITATDSLNKVQHTDVPLSYYTGLLGTFIMLLLFTL